MVFEVLKQVRVAFDGLECVNGADSECETDFVEASLNDLERREVGIVGGKIFNVGDGRERFAVSVKLHGRIGDHHYLNTAVKGGNIHSGVIGCGNF